MSRKEAMRNALRARAGIEAFGLVIAMMEAATLQSPGGQARARRIIKAAKEAGQYELKALDAAIAATHPGAPTDDR